MGSNEAYREFETIVIGLYDLGALTPEVLDVIGNTWRSTDVDSGGSQDLKTADGKDLQQVVVQTFEPDAPPEQYEGEPPSYYEAFSAITRSRWDWW